MRDVCSPLPLAQRTELGEALLTIADHLKPRLMDLKPLGLAQPEEGSRCFDLGHLPATGAYQVDVVLAVDLIVAMPVVQPDRVYQPEIAEEVKGPIDRGKPDVRVLRAGAAVDLSGIKMGVPIDDPKEELPLRGEPLPGCREPFCYPFPHRFRHFTLQRFDPDPPRHPPPEGELRPVDRDQNRTAE